MNDNYPIIKEVQRLAKKLEGTYVEVQENREHIKIGGWTLSIQASKNHYCTPRVNGLPIEEYSQVELGLWHSDITPEGSFFTPDKYPEQGFPDRVAKIWRDDDVAGWVEWEDVQELVDYLRERGD